MSGKATLARPARLGGQAGAVQSEVKRKQRGPWGRARSPSGAGAGQWQGEPSHLALQSPRPWRDGEGGALRRGCPLLRWQPARGGCTHRGAGPHGALPPQAEGKWRGLVQRTGRPPTVPSNTTWASPDSGPHGLSENPGILGQPCQPTGLAGFPQEQHSRPRETRQSWVAWDMEASNPGEHRRTSKGQSPSGAGGQAGKERRPGREAGSWGGGRECQTLAGWPAWRGTPLLPAPG